MNGKGIRLQIYESCLLDTTQEHTINGCIIRVEDILSEGIIHHAIMKKVVGLVVENIRIPTEKALESIPLVVKNIVGRMKDILRVGNEDKYYL